MYVRVKVFVGFQKCALLSRIFKSKLSTVLKNIETGRELFSLTFRFFGKKNRTYGLYQWI